MRSMSKLLIGLSLLLAVAAHVRQEIIPPNKCLPGQSCFPSRQTLAEFATTLTGSVVTPSDSNYRNLVRMRNSRLTSHPYIIVVAGDVEDVQKAMRFARKHQLMVTSQASTEETTGRSTFDGSLQINLSQLRGITRLFNATARSAEGEITAAAGTTWEEMYTQARSIQRDVVASSNIRYAIGDTVGDGGIGPLVKVYGLASDNMLEAQIVTADGNLVTVSEYSVIVDFGDGLVRESYDRTFFNALASGGIGPWGVVVSYTFKLYRSPPSVVQLLARYKLWESGNYVGGETLQFLTGLLDALPEKWGGYMYVSGATSTTDIASKGEVILNMIYYDSWNADSTFDFANGILGYNSDSTIAVTRQNLSSVYAFEQLQPLDPPSTRYYTFNVLLQGEKIADDPDGADELNDALLYVLNNPTVESVFACSANILGGALPDEPRNYSFVNPALRSAIASINCGLGYPDSGEYDSFYIQRALDFEKLLSRFSEGKYRLFAETDLPEWKKQYHGDNYSHLLDVKIKWDIDNFLWCHNCVGSDIRLKCRNRQQGRSRFLRLISNGMEANDGDRSHDTRLPYVSQMSRH